MAAQQAWARQAALNTLLRYQPQKEGLADLKRAAEEHFQQSVQAGKSEGILGSQAAQAAIAPTQQIFQNAATEGERGRNLVSPVLAALSADSPFKAATANEQAAGQERLAQSQAHALSDLQQRKVAATELPAFTRAAALSKLIGELGSINAKGQSLRGAEGLNTQSEIDKQRTEAQKAALTERGQNLSSQSSAEGRRVTERGQNLTQQRAKEKAAAGTGTKPASRKEQDAAAGTIAQLRQIIGKNPGKTRAQYVAKLSEGFSAVKEGTTVVHPAIKGVKPDAVMAAALDWSEHGYMTRNTEARLRREGYDPAALGVPKEPGPPRKVSPGPHRRPA